MLKGICVYRVLLIGGEVGLRGSDKFKKKGGE
jgi:hypothetical protein